MEKKSILKITLAIFASIIFVFTPILFFPDMQQLFWQHCLGPVWDRIKPDLDPEDLASFRITVGAISEYLRMLFPEFERAFEVLKTFYYHCNLRMLIYPEVLQITIFLFSCMAAVPPMLLLADYLGILHQKLTVAKTSIRYELLSLIAHAAGVILMVWLFYNFFYYRWLCELLLCIKTNAVFSPLPLPFFMEWLIVFYLVYALVYYIIRKL